MANLSDSDRNTEWFDAPSDGPDGLTGETDLAWAKRMRARDTEYDYCIYCNLYPVKANSDYCSDACAIMAGRE